MKDRDFDQDISRFNEIYKLESSDVPSLLPKDRIEAFEDILSEEVREARQIIQKYEHLLNEQRGDLDGEARLELLTDLADWLGDIVVYCASEAKRWGLPLQQILAVIMESNFSKLDANGQPIYDHRGKVLKGPNYWKPEPRIKEIVRSKINHSS